MTIPKALNEVENSCALSPSVAYRQPKMQKNKLTVDEVFTVLSLLQKVIKSSKQFVHTKPNALHPKNHRLWATLKNENTARVAPNGTALS